MSSWHKVKAAAALADELVQPGSEAAGGDRAGGGFVCVSRRNGSERRRYFMLEGGCLAGPERLSTLGVRAVKEQTSVGS